MLSTNRWFGLPVHVVIAMGWRERFFILKRTALFFLIGIFFAWIKQPEFLSEARLMPEMNTGATDVFKKLSSVAGFTGLDLTELENTDAVRPDLYPNVLQSTPFVLYLINQWIDTTDGQRQTVGQLLLPDLTHWARIRQFFSGMIDEKRALRARPSGPVRLSARQQVLAEDINERVNAKFDTRSGLITITAMLPDAQAAAEITQLAMSYLTQYVTDYRTEKGRQDVAFYGRQLAQAQQRYQKAQLALFQHNDNHRAIATQMATIERNRLETEWQLAQTLYTELARQYEQAKVNVQERTPVFKVLEPPSVPLKRTAPKRTLIVALFTLVGFALTSLFTLFQQLGLAKQLKTVLTGETST